MERPEDEERCGKCEQEIELMKGKIDEGVSRLVSVKSTLEEFSYNPNMRTMKEEDGSLGLQDWRFCDDRSADLSFSSGQRSKDPPHLLQGQDLQKAYPAQSDSVQGRKSMAPATANSFKKDRLTRNPRLHSSHKANAGTTVSNPGMVVRQSLCFTKRRRQQRRWC